MSDKYEAPKYEILFEDGYALERGRLKPLYRIRALRDFGDVKAGDLGGYVQSYDNLSQSGNCWIYGNARVFEDAKVQDDAEIRDEAKVSGKAIIGDKAKVGERAFIYDNTQIGGRAWIHGHAFISGNVEISGGVEVSGETTNISGATKFFGNEKIHDVRLYDGVIVEDALEALLLAAAKARSDAEIRDEAKGAKIFGYATVSDRPIPDSTTPGGPIADNAGGICI